MNPNFLEQALWLTKEMNVKVNESNEQILKLNILLIENHLDKNETKIAQEMIVKLIAIYK